MFWSGRGGRKSSYTYIHIRDRNRRLCTTIPYAPNPFVPRIRMKKSDDAGTSTENEPGFSPFYRGLRVEPLHAACTSSSGKTGQGVRLDLRGRGNIIKGERQGCVAGARGKNVSRSVKGGISRFLSEKCYLSRSSQKMDENHGSYILIKREVSR